MGFAFHVYHNQNFYMASCSSASCSCGVPSFIISTKIPKWYGRAAINNAMPKTPTEGTDAQLAESAHLECYDATIKEPPPASEAESSALFQENAFLQPSLSPEKEYTLDLLAENRFLPLVVRRMWKAVSRQGRSIKLTLYSGLDLDEAADLVLDSVMLPAILQIFSQYRFVFPQTHPKVFFAVRPAYNQKNGMYTDLAPLGDGAVLDFALRCQTRVKPPLRILAHHDDKELLDSLGGVYRADDSPAVAPLLIGNTDTDCWMEKAASRCRLLALPRRSPLFAVPSKDDDKELDAQEATGVVRTWSDAYALFISNYKPEDNQEYGEQPLLPRSIIDQLTAMGGGGLVAPPGGYAPTKHAIFCGSTGTGKTLAGLLCMLNECVNAPEGKAVYLGPTRMLVAEAYDNFFELLANANISSRRLNEKNIFKSSGEAYKNDSKIADGDFKAAFIIYEKANQFFLNTQLLEQITIVIVDEVCMLTNPARGGVLDAVFTRLIAESIARARNPAQKQLRLITCSTQDLSTEKVFLKLFSDSFSHTSQGNPLCIAAIERTHPIRYMLHPMRSASHTKTVMSPMHFAFVDGAAHRQDDGCTCEAMEFIVANRAALLWESCSGHEKVIIAGVKPDEMFSYVKSFIKNKLLALHPEITDQDSRSLRLMLDMAGYNLPQQSLLCEALSYGCFFHYSDLGKHARKWYEKMFRKIQPCPFQPLFLCATETISYGVNLPADFLFLCNTSWPREKEKRGQSEFTRMTGQEFFNLSGRVGRPGHFDAAITPSVVIPWTINKDAEYDETTIESEVAPLFALRHSPEHDTDALKRFFERETKHYNDIPFPLARLFQDLLLHATAYYRKRSGPDNSKPYCRLGWLLNFMLRSYSMGTYISPLSKEIVTKLLPQKLRGFFILFNHASEGRALEIDASTLDDPVYYPTPYMIALSRTGTALASIQQLSATMEEFHQSRWRSVAGYEEAAILVSLPLLTEFWNYMRRFCREATAGFLQKKAKKIFWMNRVAEDTEKSIHILHDRLCQRLQNASMALEVRNKLHSLIMRQRDLLYPVYHGAGGVISEDVFLRARYECMVNRLACVLLGWSAGMSLTDLNNYGYPDMERSGKSDRIGIFFSESYMQKASLIVGCYRICGKDPLLANDLENSRVWQLERELRFGMSHTLVDRFLHSELEREDWFNHVGLHL